MAKVSAACGERPVSGQSLAALLDRIQRLADIGLLARAPIRTRELTIRDDGRLGVLACFETPMPFHPEAADALGALDTEGGALWRALLGIPVLRHSIRIDEPHHCSLYLERSLDTAVLDRAGALGIVDRAAIDVLRSLNDDRLFFGWGIGVEIGGAAPRGRLYAVAPNGLHRWPAIRRRIDELACELALGPREVLDTLLTVPRDALVVNVGEENGLVCLKLELPGWPVHMNPFLAPSPDELRDWLSWTGQTRLRYLGCRLSGTAPQFAYCCDLPQSVVGGL